MPSLSLLNVLLGVFVLCFQGRAFMNRARGPSSMHSSQRPISLIYDASAIEKEFSVRPLDVWNRFVDIGSPLLGWWLVRKFENITASRRSEEENQRLLNERAEDLKNCIIQGKSVAFIKSGQALALRPDIVKSPEYIRELTKLQDEVGVFSNDIAMEIFRTELGFNATDIFEFCSPDPIASASIGQVYKAKNKETGQFVAIKIQRPDVIRTCAIDMYIIQRAALYLKSRFKLRSDMLGIANEFGVQLFSELNYTQEALNCIRFKELYGSIPGIYVPDVYLQYTSTRVLTMEFVEGSKGPWATGGERLLTVGLQCSVLQLLESGFFHADPHRGNLLQTPDGKLAYLDFGMMSSVGSEQRYALIGTVLGLVNKDFSLVIDNMKKLQFFPPDTDTSLVVDALTSALNNSTSNGRISSLNFTQLNKNIESLERTNLLPVRLPPFYTFIIRSLTILEGLALSVDPQFRLIKGAYPFIAKQLLESPNEELGKMLESVLVTKEGRIKWQKLEQFVAIAGNADAAVAGDFQALRRAQERSDLLRTYSGNQESDAYLTSDVFIKIFDYLLSENGRFLKSALVKEIVDTIDSLGLSALTTASFASSGILPPPAERPDRQRVVQFLKFLGFVANSVSIRYQTGSDSLIQNRMDGNSQISWDPRLVDFRALRRAFEDLVSMLQERSSDPAGSSNSLLISRVSSLITDILQGILERNARRAARTVFSPSNLEALAPALSRILDFLPIK